MGNMHWAWVLRKARPMSETPDGTMSPLERLLLAADANPTRISLKYALWLGPHGAMMLRNWIRLGFGTALLGIETQRVIGLRLLTLAGGGLRRSGRGTTDGSEKTSRQRKRL